MSAFLLFTVPGLFGAEGASVLLGILGGVVAAPIGLVVGAGAGVAGVLCGLLGRPHESRIRVLNAVGGGAGTVPGSLLLLSPLTGWNPWAVSASVAVLAIVILWFTIRPEVKPAGGQALAEDNGDASTEEASADPS